jgi:hypothetical protein
MKMQMLVNEQIKNSCYMLAIHTMLCLRYIKMLAMLAVHKNEQIYKLVLMKKVDI